MQYVWILLEVMLAIVMRAISDLDFLAQVNFFLFHWFKYKFQAEILHQMNQKETQVPIISAISSTTISISWEYDYTISYQVALVDPNGNLVI